MSSDVILMAGTVIEHETVTAGVSVWAIAPKINEIGAVGEQAEPKEKTTLSDKIKKYDSGMRDAPDKNLKGSYIPVQVSGEEHYNDYVLQQAFITRCRNEKEFNLRINWPDGETNGFLFKALGFEFDQGTQEDWKMFTVNGKQNSRVVFAVSVTGTASVNTAATNQLAIATTPVDLDTSLGTVYWSSSDVTIATVDANGLVTGVASGVINIIAEFRGVKGVLEVTVN
jgi:uncharacterized protein YjdB